MELSLSNERKKETHKAKNNEILIVEGKNTTDL